MLRSRDAPAADQQLGPTVPRALPRGDPGLPRSRAAAGVRHRGVPRRRRGLLRDRARRAGSGDRRRAHAVGPGSLPGARPRRGRLRGRRQHVRAPPAPAPGRPPRAAPGARRGGAPLHRHERRREPGRAERPHDQRLERGGPHDLRGPGGRPLQRESPLPRDGSGDGPGQRDAGHASRRVPRRARQPRRRDRGRGDGARGGGHRHGARREPRQGVPPRPAPRSGCRPAGRCPSSRLAAAGPAGRPPPDRTSERSATPLVQPAASSRDGAGPDPLREAET